MSEDKVSKSGQTGRFNLYVENLKIDSLTVNIMFPGDDGDDGEDDQDNSDQPFTFTYIDSDDPVNFIPNN